MPFNKGDFTQQGVAGHVNAILRLNEKRLVNIDMTSNEEDEGCTITGTVTDLLNDKVYEIGSGGGGSYDDLPMCKVTVINGTAEAYSTPMLNADLQTDAQIAAPYPSIHYRPYMAAPDNHAIDGLSIATRTVTYSDSLFTDLVNCTLESEIDDDVTYWDIYVTDKTLPSSVTIDVQAFNPSLG